MTPAAPTTPSAGASRDGIKTFPTRPSHFITSRPAAATADPDTPPIRAWLELVGSPRYHVIRSQVIAPTRPARTTSGVMKSASTIPFATVAATANDANAPRKFRIAAPRTARRGETARVDTLVAIAFAVS